MCFHPFADIIIDSNSTTMTTETNLQVSLNVIGIPTDRVPICPEYLKPSIGKTFATLDEGLAFYKDYAKICGFTSRLDSSKTNKGVVTHKQCVCNKQGESKHEGLKRKRAVTRVGCEAKINFIRLGTGEYEIYEFVEYHTHPMVTPDTMIHLKSSMNLNLVHKKMIMDNSRINQGPVKSCRMFKEYVRGYKNVGASLEDFKKISRDVKKYIKEYDAQMLIETFMQKKSICPSFYFDFEADPIAGLIAKENVVSFTCLFENYLKAMGGCYPITLITDQCLGIKAGVEKVFSGQTEHRCCMWHIMKKMPEKVGSTISRDTDFLKEITGIVWGDDIEPLEFEEQWKLFFFWSKQWKLITDKYELSENEWLTQIFEMRESWIPSYFRDTYLGGIMRTTSRSEFENSFFSHFTNPHLSLVEFWMRFQTAMDGQRWKHSKLTADSKNSSPILSTPLKLERQASEFYTPNVFYEFKEELKQAFADREKNKVYEVVSSENKFMHILWVLNDKGFDEIPPNYLLSRWSKNASCRPIFNVSGTSLLANCASIDTRQHKISELWSEVFKSASLVEDDEDNIEGLLYILYANRSQRKKAEIEILIGSKIPNEAVVLPPKQSKNKGSVRRMMNDKENSIQEHQKPLRKFHAL
ncbi:hypothetical protein RND81_13G026600 [Saponaria officinalis]|uniref:Protein FAR1-RELATED SEQUENCE n=1 Tax=Saponaria officinalis TaxID=3572 RepID=A0AAW1GVD2_SAPOF